MISTLAGLAVTAVALSGCVAVDDGSRSGAPDAAHSSASTPSTSAPAESDTSAEPSDSPKPTKATHAIIDLDSEQGTSYVFANDSGGLLSPSKVLGPWMVQFVVDGDRVTYREVVCTGTAANEATGDLEGSGTERVIRWDDGDDPWLGNAPSETTDAEITDTTMRAGLPDAATTDVEGEKAECAGYCKKAGEDIADIFLK